MFYNPHTPRLNAFEELWATNKPIPYEQPLPASYYETLPQEVLKAQMSDLQEYVEPDLDFYDCPKCGVICSCIMFDDGLEG